MLEPPLPAPIIHDAAPDSPLILSVPHSGRAIPKWLAGKVQGGERALTTLADPWVDKLVEHIVAKGAGAVIAAAPRGAIDCNRQADELDPLAVAGAMPPMAGSKAAMGLGLIPSRGPGGRSLWSRPLPEAVVEQRLSSAYHPYHHALDQMIDQVAVRHGGAIMLDCHSMPPLTNGHRIILGDDHGRSCAPWLTRTAADWLRGTGWNVALNRPYAGGEIIRRHANPTHNIHAIQIEIDRSAYLDPLMRSPGAGFRRVQLMLEKLAATLTQEFKGRAWPMAAE